MASYPCSSKFEWNLEGHNFCCILAFKFEDIYWPFYFWHSQYTSSVLFVNYLKYIQKSSLTFYLQWHILVNIQRLGLTKCCYTDMNNACIYNEEEDKVNKCMDIHYNSNFYGIYTYIEWK